MLDVLNWTREKYEDNGHDYAKQETFREGEDGTQVNLFISERMGGFLDLQLDLEERKFDLNNLAVDPLAVAAENRKPVKIWCHKDRPVYEVKSSAGKGRIC